MFIQKIYNSQHRDKALKLGYFQFLLFRRHSRTLLRYLSLNMYTQRLRFLIWPMENTDCHFATTLVGSTNLSQHNGLIFLPSTIGGASLPGSHLLGFSIISETHFNFPNGPIEAAFTWLAIIKKRLFICCHLEIMCNHFSVKVNLQIVFLLISSSRLTFSCLLLVEGWCSAKKVKPTFYHPLWKGWWALLTSFA